MPVRDIVGQWEIRAAVNDSPTSSSSPHPAPRRLSLPPPSSSPAPSLNASISSSSGTLVPPARPARFVRHPLLVQSPASLPPVTPPRTSRHDLTTPSPISSSSRRQSFDSRRLSFAAAQREAASTSPPSRSAAAQDQQPSRATVSTARRISLPPSIASHASDTQSITVAASVRSTSRPRLSADALSPARSSQDTLRNPFQDPAPDTSSSTAEFLPLQPVLKDVVEEHPPSPTSTLIPLSVDKRGRRRHEPIPAKTVFAKTAPPLHLPHLNEYLAALDEPVFGHYPSDEPEDDKRRGRRRGKGKTKDEGEPPMFPPMAAMEATGLSLDDLEHNAPRPRPWEDRNSVFRTLSNLVLGATGSSAVAKHYSLQGIYDGIQVFALVLTAAVPSEVTANSGWRKLVFDTIPNILALNFGSSFTQSLVFLCIFLSLTLLLLYYFHKTTAQLKHKTIREGLQPVYDDSGWVLIITTFGLTILYLPLSTIALHGILWSSDFWVVPNPYINATVPFPPPPLGPTDLYHDPLDFCYATTMRKDHINYAPVIVILSTLTFIFMSFWFPYRLYKAIKATVPHVDPYTEIGRKRTADERETEYMRLLDRDNSPFAFLYSDFRRSWAAYKSIYIWGKLSTLLIVAVLDPDNCAFRNTPRNTVNVVRQAVMVVAMILFFLLQCFLAPFNDPVSNASEWISRLNYVSTSAVGLLVALNVPGSNILNGPVIMAIYIVTYGLSFYFSVINFSWAHRLVKRLRRRIDFSIDIFSPHLDISSSSPHARRRIWQETLSVLLLTAPDCKMPEDHDIQFVIHREHEWPPYLLNFHGSPAERHVENLKILREVGWSGYTQAAALHSGELGARFRELERTIVRNFIGPDAYWSDPNVRPVPGQMSYFGCAWWIPFPPTLVMHYDSGNFTTLTKMQEFEDFVVQNGTRRMEHKRHVRRALRALDGKVVHWPYTHVEFVGRRTSMFGGPGYTAQKMQHFRHCVLHIKRKGELVWNRVQLGSGFQIELTFSKEVQTDGTIIGLDEDFDLTPSLARFLQLNTPLVQMNLHTIDTALVGYRKHAWKELKQKESTLSYRFLAQVYNRPDQPSNLAERALDIEQDLRVRSVVLSQENAFNAAYQRMAIVTSTPVRTFWYIFWDDFWRRNHDTVPPLETHHIDFDPRYPSSIAYRPLSRPALESFLVQRGLLSTPPRKGDFFCSGLVNKLMFRLNSIVFYGSRYEIMLHFGGKPLELTMEEVDWALHQRGSTQGTGGGTDHDDSSIRPRGAFTWETIWDDPVSPGRWKRSSWRSRLSVWMGLRPRWTTWTTNGLALDVRLERGKYVVIKRWDTVDEVSRPPSGKRVN